MIVEESIFRADIASLTKEQLCTVLGNTSAKSKKEELVKELVQQTIGTGNEILLRKIYSDFGSILAMLPRQLEEYLNITPNERKKWTKNRRLPVLEERPFKKWGQINYYPVYDRYKVYQITEEQIKTWREEDERIKAQNKLKGIEKAKETKKINDGIREDFKKEWKSLLASWKKIDPLIAVTFQLAYWCVWISRWAKEYQLKTKNAISIKKSEEYKQRVDALYQLKNRAIKMLLLSPYKSIGFYRPENPNKVYFHMCDYHYSLWREEREELGEYINKWEFFHFHQKEIKKCPNCVYEVDKDYYSLFYLVVESKEVPDFKFSFHTPYPIGKDFFPSANSLSKVEHEERDGLFRFGRPLFDEEKIIYREKDVLKYFEKALIEFSLYFPSKSVQEKSVDDSL